MHRRLKLKDAFPTSADTYTKPLERVLELRRADLNREWEELEQGWAAINERMVRFGVAARTDDEGVVKLNVGGSNVTASWHLLAEAEVFKDSTLGALLEGVWGKGRIPRDADGRIVLDESSVCIMHIVHKALTGRASSVGAVGLPECAARLAVANDEVPYLIYTAHVMGLSGYMPTKPIYPNVTGSSTVLEPFEIAPFGAKIREWVGGSTSEMALIYRATRDGFGRKFFRARCDKRSPETVSLIRVSSGQGRVGDDSVFGVYSVVTWAKNIGSFQKIAGRTFVFLLKDRITTDTGLVMPIKWNPNPGYVNTSYVVPQGTGPYIGADDLVTTFDPETRSFTIQTKQNEGHFPPSSSLLFSALDGKRVIEIEVYRCSTPAQRSSTPAQRSSTPAQRSSTPAQRSCTPMSPTTPLPPSTTEAGGDALTDAEALDIRSYGETIASLLMRERVVLDRAAKEMETARSRVSAAVEALETVYGPNVAVGEEDTVVDLNVRGTRMTTLRSTLRACPRSALATMFDADRWPATDKDKDEHGRRLIDCNPTCFSKILDALRMRKRASWGRGVTPEKQEGSSGKCPGAILVNQADMKAFRTAVEMYFPGCESFIMGLCSVNTTPAGW